MGNKIKKGCFKVETAFFEVKQGIYYLTISFADVFVPSFNTVLIR